MRWLWCPQDRRYNGLFLSITMLVSFEVSIAFCSLGLCPLLHSTCFGPWLSSVLNPGPLGTDLGLLAMRFVRAGYALLVHLEKSCWFPVEARTALRRLFSCEGRAMVMATWTNAQIDKSHNPDIPHSRILSNLGKPDLRFFQNSLIFQVFEQAFCASSPERLCSRRVILNEPVDLTQCE